MADPLDRLPRRTRAGLDTFSQAVERIPFDDLPLYAARPLGSDHQAAVDRAAVVARDNGREAAVNAVRETIVGYITRRFSDGQYRPTWAGLSWVSAGTADDRVKIAVSLREAITAIALWDLLDEGDRDELLGAWAGLAG